MNRKMYQGAMRSILSELVRQERLIVVSDFVVNEPKTKAMIAKLKDLGISSDILVITDNIDENLYLSSRNLSSVDVRDSSALDPLSLIAYEKVLVTTDAIKNVEEMLG